MFRAHDPARDRLVAIKQFTLELPPERLHQLVALFEHLIAAELIHDAIATPIATGIADGSVYLAQESVSAESLDHAVREYGPAPAGDAVRVATELAGALDFAAVVYIHHGSLHPRDVLLSPDVTKLTGLGVAHALEQVGVTPPVRRPYSAPERLAGAGWDRRADIFSLAALVHELLWGRRLTGLGAKAVASLPDVAACDMTALRAAFARALAEDPRERFDTALGFAEALKGAFAPDAIPAQRARVTAPRLPLDGAAIAISSPEPRGFDLRAAEEERYADVTSAPAIVTGADEDSSVSSASSAYAASSAFPLPPVDRSPSRLGPLVVMLAFGVTAGLAAGYLAWSRPDPVAPVQTDVAPKPPAPTPAARPQGREFTETAVPATPKAPDSPPAPPPNHPAQPAAPKSDATNATNPNPAAGRLLVRSTPAGATVIVDGREEGETPIAVRDLSRGTHRVRLVRDGYAPEERQVVITASRPAQSILVTMSDARATGSHGTVSSSPVPSTPATTGRFTGDVVVESKPPGAKVYIDNKLSGTTPLSLQQVAAGNHVIRLEREGYRRWSASVRIVAAERNRVTASLER